MMIRDPSQGGTWSWDGIEGTDGRLGMRHRGVDRVLGAGMIGLGERGREEAGGEGLERAWFVGKNLCSLEVR